MLRELTPREKEVVRLLVLGYSNTQIAEILCIAYSTAKAHVQAVLAKLNVKNRVQAAVVAANFLGITPQMIVKAACKFPELSIEDFND
ncbi:MAG: helix-turn-helix transcriptional regulator [Fusobacterium sp.]|nr:helix-turn-helix transcriptional regulator [Fusobacterium sp.]